VDDGADDLLLERIARSFCIKKRRRSKFAREARQFGAGAIALGERLP
jgi:hypothetical protein